VVDVMTYICSTNVITVLRSILMYAYDIVLCQFSLGTDFLILYNNNNTESLPLYPN